MEIKTRSAPSVVDVTVKKYCEDPRLRWSKFSCDIEDDRRPYFHCFSFATFNVCCPYTSGGPLSAGLWVHSACCPENASGFETHYNPGGAYLYKIAHQYRQSKVKKPLYRLRTGRLFPQGYIPGTHFI